MASLTLKKASLYLALGAFWALGTVSGWSQTFSSGTVPDPEVLVSERSSGNTSTHNLEITLVDIKAVDAPALHTENGKTGVGAEDRYGQGIIIDPSGIIATNRHIIGNAQHIYVMLSGGKTFEAAVLSKSLADLCLIKINTPYPLRAISMADSSDIQVGSNVIAIANAGFNPQRILGGQVIKIFKETSSSNVEVLEMNIRLKPGDSGGPILNQEGSLLGLIMGKQISDPSKSYAIPSSKIQQEYFKYRNSILN
jgi:S1-C subfamily serine protease